jgi:hypothetical protein
MSTGPTTQRSTDRKPSKAPCSTTARSAIRGGVQNALPQGLKTQEYWLSKAGDIFADPAVAEDDGRGVAKNHKRLDHAHWWSAKL